MYYGNIIHGPTAADHIFCANQDIVFQNQDSENLCVRTIDLKECADKKRLLKTMACSLSFPGYFSYNWDSFEECVSDLDWLIQGTLVMVFLNCSDPEMGENQITTLFSILRDIAIEWNKEQKRKLVIVSVGKRSVAFNIALKKNKLRLKDLELEKGY